MTSKFRKQVMEICETDTYSDHYIFEKLSEILLKNAQRITEEIIEPTTFEKHLTDSLTTLKSEIKDLEFKSNIASLDSLTGGFDMGEYVLIGARPGMGKSYFLQYLMLQAARKFPILYFTLDTGKENFMIQLLSSLTEIRYENFKKKNISENQWSMIERVYDDIRSLPIHICDEATSSVQLFKAMCERYIENEGVKVIFIDFIQLLSSNRYRYSREVEMSYISRVLKNIARDNNICIIATSQLSRSCESRGGDKKPIMSDLRESGSFEQDADKVLFLYRPEYYGFTMDENGNSIDKMLEIIVAKNRNGYIGSSKVRHNMPHGGILPFVPFQSNLTFNENRLKELDENDSPF